jgi:hypothetical protein
VTDRAALSAEIERWAACGGTWEVGRMEALVEMLVERVYELERAAAERRRESLWCHSCGEQVRARDV